MRDLLVLSVDPSRIDDPEIASESERDRLKGLVSRFSREDLLRAFDVLSKAEFDIRARVAAAGITSRWRCCAGFTCASWCR